MTFEEWWKKHGWTDDYRGSMREAWLAACCYKDKVIADFRVEVQAEIQESVEKDKRIAELETHVFAISTIIGRDRLRIQELEAERESQYVHMGRIEEDKSALRSRIAKLELEVARLVREVTVLLGETDSGDEE